MGMKFIRDMLTLAPSARSAVADAPYLWKARQSTMQQVLDGKMEATRGGGHAYRDVDPNGQFFMEDHITNDRVSNVSGYAASMGRRSGLVGGADDYAGGRIPTGRLQHTDTFIKARDYNQGASTGLESLGMLGIAGGIGGAMGYLGGEGKFSDAAVGAVGGMAGAMGARRMYKSGVNYAYQQSDFNKVYRRAYDDLGKSRALDADYYKQAAKSSLNTQQQTDAYNQLALNYSTPGQADRVGFGAWVGTFANQAQKANLGFESAAVRRTAIMSGAGLTGGIMGMRNERKRKRAAYSSSNLNTGKFNSGRGNTIAR